MASVLDIDKGYDDKRYFHVTADLKRYRINQLKNMPQNNSRLVIDYLNSRMGEGNLKPASRANTIDRLSRLSSFHGGKSFREMTAEHIFSYLDSIRRTENEDPMHKWIGTYNLSIIKIVSFFKWMYEPDTHSSNRKIPSFLASVKCLKRKEKTTCCAKDLWTQEESPQSPQSLELCQKKIKTTTESNDFLAFPPNCYYCAYSAYKTKREYESHVVKNHKGKLGYPGIADKKKYGIPL